MRLNANQLNTLAGLSKDGEWFHFDFAGYDPLDKRVVNIKMWSFDYREVRIVDINENGTVFERAHHGNV